MGWKERWGVVSTFMSLGTGDLIIKRGGQPVVDDDVRKGHGFPNSTALLVPEARLQLVTPLPSPPRCVRSCAVLSAISSPKHRNLQFISLLLVACYFLEQLCDVHLVVC